MTTATVEASQAEKQLVVFDLATEAYGVDIGAVREIIRMQDITKVPRCPEFVEGIINLRGSVIPVVDLRKRFNLAVSEQNKDNRIVVVDIRRPRHRRNRRCRERGAANPGRLRRASVFGHHDN